MKKKHNKITTKQGVLIFIALFAIFYILIYVVPTVSDIFRQTYIAEYGTLEVSRDANCIIVRNEETYKADISGKVERIEKSGELVKSGSHIVTVGQTAMYNDQIGIVSYYYDGYESKLNSETLDGLKETFFYEFKDGPGVQKAVSSSAEASNVVFKIIDRTKWYVVCWLDSEDEELFQVGRNVTVDFGDEEQVQMEVDSVTKQNKKIKVVFATNRLYEDFDKYRTKECTITVRSSNGIIINTDSMVEEKGVKGVYVVDKYGNANFTPVQIYQSQGDKTVVAKNYYYDSEGYPVETVKNYDEILKKGKK